MKMMDIVRDCMRQRVEEIREQFVNTRKEMDLIAEVSKTLIKILLSCAFGEDLSNIEIDYYINGVKTRQKISFVLREVFHKCIMREISLQVALFPTSAQYCISPSDRENQNNIYILRELFAQVVEKRRKND